MALYDGYGKSISVSGDEHGLFYYNPVDETAKTMWAYYTYQQLIDKVYEPLRTAFPNYITRSVIGKDASGTYDIYQYTFAPDYPEQTIFLQAGCHAREEDGWIGLARLMQIICNEWETHPGLAYLRWSCKIVCVPVVNVWGVSQARSSRGDNNSNGVNLNRDLTDATQSETVAVKGLIDSILESDGINFALDFHTTVVDTFGDYMLTVWTGSENEKLAKRVLYMLARKNAPERMASYLSKYSLGENDLNLPNVGDSTNSGTYAEYFKTIGIPGATVEHSDYVWDSDKATAITVTKAVECYANQLIQHANEKFGL